MRFRGEVLRELRRARGDSQTTLGQRIGAHVTSISDWERGDNAPSSRHIASLARELGVPIEHFYADDDEEAVQVGGGDDLVAALAVLLKAAVAAEVAKYAKRDVA